MPKRNTKQHIIEVASELFYHRGYNLTGINEIIATAGIAKATLYDHFKSKEDICLSYIDYKDNTFIEEITAYCKQRPAGKKRVIAILEFLTEFFHSGDFNGCWCIRTIAEVPRDNHRVINKIRASKQKFIDFISEVSKENIKGIRAKKMDQLSKRVYLLYESAVSEAYLQGEIWPIENSIEMLKDMLKTYK